MAITNVQLPKDTPVLVIWEDSCGADRWLTEEERDEFFARPALLLHTIGFIMRDDDQVLGLVETISFDSSNPGKQWGSCIMIPRAVVRKVTELVPRLKEANA